MAKHAEAAEQVFRHADVPVALLRAGRRESGGR